MSEQIDRSVTCAFTGHRPTALPWGDQENDPRCLALKKKLMDTVAHVCGQGYRHFICGMALGADFYFCEAVLSLRSAYPEIRLEAAIPFPGQSDRWNKAQRERYQALLSACDMETLIQKDYALGCMQRRNRYMVDHASRLIAVYNGKPGGSGTLHTLHYALQQGLKVDILEV